LLEPGRHEIEDQVAEGDQVVTRLAAHGVDQRDLPSRPLRIILC
jgi:predicted ester cyclase